MTAASFLGANFKFTEKISSDFFKLNTRNSDEHEKEEVQDKRWFIRSRRAVASSLVVSVQRRQGTPTHRQLSEYSLMTVFGSRLNLARFPSLFTVRNQHEIGTQGKQIKKGAVCKKWIPGRLTIGWNRPVAVHGRGHKLIFLPPTSSASRCLGIQPEQQYEPTRPGRNNSETEITHFSLFVNDENVNEAEKNVWRQQTKMKKKKWIQIKMKIIIKKNFGDDWPERSVFKVGNKRRKAESFWSRRKENRGLGQMRWRSRRGAIMTGRLLSDRPTFQAPPPLQSETQLLAAEGKKKVEANLVLKLFSNAGPINDLTFRERPRKLPESLSCFTSITQVKQQQQQQGKLWNMNIFVPWPFSFGPRFVVERCGRRIWKEAAATLVNIFTHKSLGVAMNRISDHWWPRQLSSRQSPIDGQEVLLGP